MAQKPVKNAESGTVHFVFGKQNYQLLIASIVVVVIGFLLMIGTTDIYSFRKIVLAPIVVIGGFILGFFAIFRKSPDKI
jgi:hypothetical protein